MIWGLLKILPSEILRTTETIPEMFRGARNVYLMQLGEPRNSIRKLWRPGKHILFNCGWRPGIHPLVIWGPGMLHLGWSRGPRKLTLSWSSTGVSWAPRIASGRIPWDLRNQLRESILGPLDYPRQNFLGPQITEECLLVHTHNDLRYSFHKTTIP